MAAGGSKEMQIFIKSLNGTKQEMTLGNGSDSTIQEVKEQLQEKEGIPAEQLRIIFRGKLFNDSRSQRTITRKRRYSSRTIEDNFQRKTTQRSRYFKSKGNKCW